MYFLAPFDPQNVACGAEMVPMEAIYQKLQRCGGQEQLKVSCSLEGLEFYTPKVPASGALRRKGLSPTLTTQYVAHLDLV